MLVDLAFSSLEESMYAFKLVLVKGTKANVDFKTQIVWKIENWHLLLQLEKSNFHLLCAYDPEKKGGGGTNKNLWYHEEEYRQKLPYCIAAKRVCMLSAIENFNLKLMAISAQVGMLCNYLQ
jgi:hypothetical protein